jgi:hypothetical protein
MLEQGMTPSRVDTQTVHMNEAGAATATDTLSAANEQQEALPALPQLDNANTNGSKLRCSCSSGNC